MHACALWAVVRIRRGNESAVRAPRQSYEVTPTGRSHYRRPDAMAVRQSLGQRTGQGRVASWHQPHNQVCTARCARVLRALSSDSRRGNESTLRAPWESSVAMTTVRSRSRRPDAVAVQAKPRPTNWAEVHRELAPATQSSPLRAVLACVLRGRSSDSQRGDERAVRTSRESNAVTPTVRSRSRRPGAVAVRRSLGQRTGQKRIASWPQPHNQVRTAQCWRACSVGGRPILDGAIRARCARHGSRAWQCRRYTSLPLTRCGGRAAKPRPITWAGAGRKLAPATQPSRYCAVHSRALWAVVRASTGL